MLSAHYLQLVTDAALKSMWYKHTFRDFLRRSGVPESLIATWAHDESKRDFLDRLLPHLEKTNEGIEAINRICDALSQQETFPDLSSIEDSRRRIQAAKEAVGALRRFCSHQAEQARGERDRKDSRDRYLKHQREHCARQQSLDKLNARLAELATQLGQQGAGYQFEKWFYDLVEFFDIAHRRPYNVKGRQVDGSMTLDGTTYLGELKFTVKPADAPEVDIFRSKIRSKADNTMGIMVSVSGYTSVAIAEASGERTPLLLLDCGHLYMVLTGAISLKDLVDRVRRHASQTGEAYLRPGDFGN
ncbi:MAG TPA: hypothetical protein VMF91_25800 [Bryobacteraceae bacterium]|nr:hypothetical protein [Bryobacteraceae bacterium]